MRADRVEVSWDSSKSKWLARIHSGEEVIRRYCNLSNSADDQVIRTAVLQLVQDEGYEPSANVEILRAPARASA
ncbi:MAG: hypothetical protein WAM91_13465 [Candidatus Acidiferrales bacterium]